MQAALVALDPRTGEIKALIGGREYGQSQLNHALAHRQPGSVFKPFVYAAAFDNAVDGAQPVITPATTVDDEPTVFEFDGQEYTPNNYGERFMGKVTVRQALTNSLNVATVKVAEMVGYGRVVQIARQMGLGSNIRPTPAVALGAYELTPVEVAGAYTAFATIGTRADPFFIKTVVSADGNSLEKVTPTNKLVLDPRVAYLVDSILEDVLNKGTGAQVRAKGFTLPAAGKTGTSRDGWFAGFTSNLVCVIWIGFDDNHDLGLAGGSTAAPIWADFMMKATTMPGYRDVKDFEKPEGVDTVILDADTQQVATPGCPADARRGFRGWLRTHSTLRSPWRPRASHRHWLVSCRTFSAEVRAPRRPMGRIPRIRLAEPQRPRDSRDRPLLTRRRPRKRKRGHCRSFLVSLGTRKRKIRRNLIRIKGVSP